MQQCRTDKRCPSPPIPPPTGGGPAGAAEADPHHLAFCAAVVASLPYKRGDEPCLVVQVRRLVERPSPLLCKPHGMPRLAPWQRLAAPAAFAASNWLFLHALFPPPPQEINAVVSRLGEGVREELKRALYGTASVSGSMPGRMTTAGLAGKLALWWSSVGIAAGAACATARLLECPGNLRAHQSRPFSLFTGA